MNRNANGVLERWDGGGDAFANAHRVLTDRDCYMNDIDGLLGIELYGIDGGDRVFVEYAVKTRQPTQTSEVAWVAIIDRKRSIDAMYNSARSCGFLCGTCRLLAGVQPHRPKFYYAVGGQQGPWTLHIVDTDTEVVGDQVAIVTSHEHWRDAWRELGLRDLRNELNRWLIGMVSR